MSENTPTENTAELRALIEHLESCESLDAQDYEEAAALAQEAASNYYEGDGTTNILSDAQYDHLMRLLSEYEKQHPQESKNVSTQVAAGAVTGDVPHAVPMLSLDNVFSGEGFSSWARSAQRSLNQTKQHKATFCVEPKLDGLAMSIHYENGVPTRMTTRGDGLKGEDATAALGNITNLPQSAIYRGPSFAGGGMATRDLRVEFFTGEVRGEVIFSKKQFEEGNKLREAHGSKPFANPRNGVSGAVRGAAGREYDLPMSFLAYDVVAKNTWYDTHAGAMMVLKHMGFTTAQSLLKDPTLNSKELHHEGVSLEKVLEIIDQFEEQRKTLDYVLDGMVIKVNEYWAREALGSGSRAPRWAIAYKYPAEENIATLLGINWQVGRTGVVTPRAHVSPTMVDGTLISYATLHNPQDIERKGFLMGDKVYLERAGEVIPYVKAPVEALRTGEETPIVMPETCPECGSELDKSQARWRCVRGRQCQTGRLLSYAVSSNILDIDGLGPKQVEKLIAAGVADLGDLFLQDEDSLLRAGLGQAMSKRIAAQLEQAKSKELWRFIAALGIKGTGRAMSKALANHFGSMDALMGASVSELQSVDKVGEVKAQDFHAEMEDLLGVLDKLHRAGVSLELEAPQAGAGDSGSATTEEGASAQALVGEDGSPLRVCVTGKMVGPLASYGRTAMEELIERCGGESASSVSKSTNLLVANLDARGSSKGKNAVKYGVPMLTEEEFAQRLGLA